MRAARIAVFGAGLAACGLFPDVGALSSDDAAVSDVVVSDVVPSDAPGDAPSDAPPASPCAAMHTFCDDFDQTPLGQKWDNLVQNSGPLALSTASFITSPHALEATGNATGSPSDLEKSFPSVDHTHVEFDLKIESPTNVTNTEVDFITIDLTQPPPGWGFAIIGLSRTGGTTTLEQYESPTDGGVATKQDVAIGESFASWRHVALDLLFLAQTFEVTIDGTVVATMHFTPQLTQSPLSMAVGAAYVANTNGNWNVFVDDFVVDQN